MIGEESCREVVWQWETGWEGAKILIQDWLSVMISVSLVCFPAPPPERQNAKLAQIEENVGVKNVQGVKSRVWYMHVCMWIQSFHQLDLLQMWFSEKRRICLQHSERQPSKYGCTGLRKTHKNKNPTFRSVLCGVHAQRYYLVDSIIY